MILFTRRDSGTTHKKMTTTQKAIMPKMKSRASGKDVYLLGADSDGIYYWLESPSWDCGWYWGFGYVETYTNNTNPAKSRDINSHEHIDSSFIGKHEYYDMDKKCFVPGEYIHNIYDSPRLSSVTFDQNTGWKLTELFKQFYLLKEMADFTHKSLPGCHVTASPVNHGDLKDWNKNINEVMIPAITSKIIELLTP